MFIREATADDVPVIRKYIYELAEYEKSQECVKVTDELLLDTLFSVNPKVFCHVVAEDSIVVGIVVWFLNYSTWLGKHGIYVEDLYITPQYRGRGFGRALLKTLASICLTRGYERLQWWVLDWNESAIEFYHEIGAKKMSEWIVMRVDNANEALTNLATTEK